MNTFYGLEKIPLYDRGPGDRGVTVIKYEVWEAGCVVAVKWLGAAAA